MRRALLLAFVLTAVVSAQDKRPAPAQAERGRELFVKSTKGAPCATCHAIGGVGTAVGPDLKNLASAVGPRGIIMAINMKTPVYVRKVEVYGGTPFSAIEKQKAGDSVEMWDLSQNPPAIRKLQTKDVKSMNADETWKHPPIAAGYTSQELADIIGFLKWVAAGSRTEIKPADIE